uniref:Uncharacterized protein n=1 Tax=Glossina brevipalpis TaxID=37001 RepID=A0A1A9WCU3_9MUSC
MDQIRLVLSKVRLKHLSNGRMVLESTSLFYFRTLQIQILLVMLMRLRMMPYARTSASKHFHHSARASILNTICYCTHTLAVHSLLTFIAFLACVVRKQRNELLHLQVNILRSRRHIRKYFKNPLKMAKRAKKSQQEGTLILSFASLIQQQITDD